MKGTFKKVNYHFFIMCQKLDFIYIKVHVIFEKVLIYDILNNRINSVRKEG